MTDPEGTAASGPKAREEPEGEGVPEPGPPRPRPALDPSAEELRRLGHATVDRLVEHLERLSELPVVRPGRADELVPLVDEPLPLEGRGFEDGLDFFFERVVPRMTHVGHPRFHAYIPCPGNAWSALGQLLAAVTNPFVGSWLGGASVAALELVVLRWIAEAIGYEPDASGLLTSGGSMANLGAIAAARARLGREVQERGRLYLSDQGHGSAEKAALVLGFAPETLRRIPTDERFRLDVEALRTAIAEDRAAGRVPFLVSANAGTTNTGAVDPLPAIADLCAEEGLWFHVDAAYGGFAALCDEGRRKLRGMERADSLTLDPHKWLYAPIGCGCLLVRDRAWLEAAFATEGDYLKDVPRDEVNFFDRGPELSRPARVLSVWTLLRSVGIDALRRQIEEDLRLARLAEELLLADGRFELAAPTELSIVTFRHRASPGESQTESGRRDDELMRRLLDDGEVMLSSTTLRGRTALRLVVMNHRTTEAELRHSVGRVLELA